MGSLLIEIACNADLCLICPKIRNIREMMTLEKAQDIHEMYKASHE